MTSLNPPQPSVRTELIAALTRLAMAAREDDPEAASVLSTLLVALNDPDPSRLTWLRQLCDRFIIDSMWRES